MGQQIRTDEQTVIAASLNANSNTHALAHGLPLSLATFDNP